MCQCVQLEDKFTHLTNKNSLKFKCEELAHTAYKLLIKIIPSGLEPEKISSTFSFVYITKQGRFSQAMGVNRKAPFVVHFKMPTRFTHCMEWRYNFLE